MSTRINYIDQLKGLAMLLVVMGHVSAFDFFSLETVPGTFLNNIITSLQMPLFFFLSGIVVRKKDLRLGGVVRDIWKRFRGLIVPMVVVGLIYALWRGFTVYEFIINPMKYGYWYLLTLFEFYIIYYLLFEIPKVDNKYVQMLIGCAVLLALKVILHFPINGNICNIMQLVSLVSYWPFFFLGFFLSQNNLLTRTLENNHIYTISLLVYGVLFAWNYYGVLSNLVVYIYQLAGIIMVSHLFYEMRNKQSRILENLSFIGRNTLDVYIFHYFIISASYIKLMGNYLMEYPNILIEVLATTVYASATIYGAIGIGRILRSSQMISRFLFNSK